MCIFFSRLDIGVFLRWAGKDMKRVKKMKTRQRLVVIVNTENIALKWRHSLAADGRTRILNGLLQQCNKEIREILYFWKEIVFQRVLFYFALALSLEAFSIWIISLSICLYAKTFFWLIIEQK